MIDGFLFLNDNPYIATYSDIDLLEKSTGWNILIHASIKTIEEGDIRRFVVVFHPMRRVKDHDDIKSFNFSEYCHHLAGFICDKYPDCDFVYRVPQPDSDDIDYRIMKPCQLTNNRKLLYPVGIKDLDTNLTIEIKA